MIASLGSHPGPPPPGQACPRRSTHRGLGAAAPPRRRSAAPAAASFSSSSSSSSSSPGRRPAGSHARGCGGPSRPGRRTAESRRETGPRPHASSARRRRRTGRGRRHRPPRSRGVSRAVPQAPGPTDTDVRDASGSTTGCSALGPGRGTGDSPSISGIQAQGVPAFLRSLVPRCRKAALPRTHLR